MIVDKSKRKKELKEELAWQQEILWNIKVNYDFTKSEIKIIKNKIKYLNQKEKKWNQKTKQKMK